MVYPGVEIPGARVGSILVRDVRVAGVVVSGGIVDLCRAPSEHGEGLFIHFLDSPLHARVPQPEVTLH